MSIEVILKIGEAIDNDRIKDIFKVGNMGGMRRSHATNSLVIVSDHTKGIYDDRWENDVLLYTGMGQAGDQTLSSQNKTLYESVSNGVDIYLFEVHQEGEYRYHGVVELAAAPYQDIQFDVNHHLRKVWIFPVRPKQISTPAPVPAMVLDKLQKKRERRAQKLSNEDLAARAKSAAVNPGKVKACTTSFYRNADVAEYARRRAKGDCELCGNKAPFLDQNGKPYLEVHHIKWLAHDGSDTVDNTVALCPNCHRRMHILDSPVDRVKLTEAAQKTI